jgi:hypothetical protein
MRACLTGGRCAGRDPAGHGDLGPWRSLGAPTRSGCWSRCFAERIVDKRYVAIVVGRPEPSLPDPDGWSPICSAADRGMARPPAPEGRSGGRKTEPHPLAPDRGGPGSLGEGSRLALRPVSGRSHQLRRHLRANGHPIVAIRCTHRRRPPWRVPVCCCMPSDSRCRTPRKVGGGPGCRARRSDRRIRGPGSRRRCSPRSSRSSSSCSRAARSASVRI